MNRYLLFRLGRIFLFAIGILLSAASLSFGQAVSYSLGSLSVDIRIFNSCQIAPPNGALRFTINSTQGGVNASLVIVGPPTLFPAQSIPQGGTYTFDPLGSLPPGTYNWILGDGTNTIGSIADPVTYPPLVVQNLAPAPLGITKDIEANNTSCVAENGQVQATITGGSQTVGLGSYTYIWTSSNGTPTASGTTDGATPLNLATLLGLSGLRGGTYSLQLADNLSFCTTTAVFTITDPSPSQQTITTPSPLTICTGDNITLTLGNSEAAVTYEILRNGFSLPTPITFPGTGTGPFVMTFPSSQFASGNSILVQGSNGFCTSVLMNGGVGVNLIINPRPTPTITTGPNDVCANSTGNVYTTQAGMSNYTWVVAGGTVTAGGGLTDNTVTVTWTTVGPQSVSVNYTQNGCAAVAPFVYNVNVKPIPVPTITSGPNDVCINSTGNVYTTQAGMTNYAWIVTGGTVTAGGGAGDNTVTVTWTTVGPQNVSVSYSQNGCTAVAPFVYNVNVKALPVPTITSGPNDVCINSTSNVYTTQAGMTNYAWIVTGGTVTAGGAAGDNTVTVTWTAVGPQSVSVNYTENGCTAVAPFVYNVTVKALPVPTITSGPNDVCVSSTGNVYTTQAGMTNYAWIVTGGTVTAGGGAGDNTVTVTWTTVGPQSVSVNYTQNGCTAVAPFVYNVNVNALPVPTITSGPNDVCNNSTGNVYTTQAGMTNYAWIVTGGTVTAGGGAGDNTVTVTWTTVGPQNVSVSYTQNGCPAVAPFVYNVNVKALPVPTITSGPNDVCINSTGNVYTTQAGMTNYSWTVVGGTVTAGGGLTDNTVTVTWNTVGPQSVSINYLQNGCTAATPFVYPVTVKALPVPTITSGPNAACVNSTGNVYTTQAGMTNYVWTVVGGTVTAGGGINDNTVTVTWGTAGAQSVSINYTQNGCVAAAPTVFNVTVSPLPTADISGPATICTGGTATLSFTLSAGTYNVVYTDGTTNFNANGIVSGATVNVSPALNTTYSIVSVTNTVTTCAVVAPSPNITGSAPITVTPAPVLVTPQAKTICSGDNVAYEILLNPANLPAGTVFNWPDPDGAGPATAGVNVAMGVPGTTHINDVMTNATTAPVLVTYVVTPSTGTCAGVPANIVVTVNPTPVLAAAQSKSICTGTSVAYGIILSPANLPLGTVFNWPDPDGVGPATAGVNVPMGAAGTTHINDILTNATTSPITVTYVVTPSVGTCNGTPGNITVTVNPIPVLAFPQLTSICSGDNVGYEILMNPASLPLGTVFNWPDPDGTGPATAGVNVAMGPAGTIHIDDVLTNTSGVPITLTYVVTATNGTCAGVPRNVLVTIDPAPVLVTPQSKSICTGDNVAYEILLNPANLPAGTVFNWPDPDAAGPATAGVNVPMGAAGTTHINDVLTAAGSPVTVTYVITPTSGSGCVGVPQNVAITVNPIPVITAGQTKTICSGANVGLEILMTPVNQPTGTVFNWPDPDGAGPATAGVNVAMGATGTIHINDALTNATAAPINVTYVVTPSVGTCSGAPVNVVITVDPFPAPVLITPQAKAICSGDNVAYEILLNPANQPPGTLFSWPDPDGAGPATAGVNVPMGVAGTLHINDVLTNTTGAPVAVTYVVTPNSASGCVGTTRNVVITVNPVPVLVAGQTKTICSGANVGFEILLNPANQPAGTVFNWPDPDGAGPATAGVNVPMGIAGAIHIDDALTNATAAPINVTYVVTPFVGACSGAPVNVVITVDPFPAPVLVTPQAKTICSGDNVAYEILLNPANQPPGSLFNWPDPDGAGPATAGVNVPMGAAGTLHINDVLTNTTNAPIIVTYVVTPASASGCVGTTRNVVITVNPVPVLVAGQTKTICSGANIGLEILLNPVNQPAGTVFNWPDPDGVGPATAGVNVAMGAAGTIHIDDALTNATAAPINVTYVVTPSVGPCSGAPVNVVITVDPFAAPVLVTPQAKTICSGDNVAYEILLNPANQPPGTLFSWPDPDGTGPATAGANVPMGVAGTLHINDVLTNTTGAPVTVTYVVTPNSASGCAGTSRNVAITVNPAPALATSQSKTICSGNVVGYHILLNPANQPPGTLFNWPDPDGAGPATAGVNVAMGSAATIHINDVLTNTTGSSVIVTYVVTPSLGTCVGAPQNVVVTVRDAADPLCNGGGTDCTNFSAIVPTIVTQPSCNDRDAGEVSFTIARVNGTPTTFRVLWTIGATTQTKFTSNTVSFNDLSSGAYQYTIIDEGNGKSCGPVDFFLDLATQVNILDKQVTSNVTCFGGTDGNAILSVDGSSTGEYWYKYVLDGVESSAQTFTPGAPLPGGLPADDDDFIIIKVDESFNFTCPDTVMVRIRHTFAKIDYTVSSTEVTTCNGTDGSIIVSSIGGGNSASNPLQVRLKKAVPFTTDPSGYVVLIDFEDVANGVKEYMDLTQGNYVVDVKDDLDCIQSKPIAVQAPGQVPLSSVTVTPSDATCINEGESGSITVVISDAGLFQVAVSQDQINVPEDDEFVDYSSPGLPSITFNNLSRGAYYLYIKSSTTTCPTRTDAINIGGVQAIDSFEVLSNCVNQNLTINNITGQTDAPFVIRVYDMDDKFVKIDSLTSSSIPLSRSVTFVYNPPLEHSFLGIPGTYRFVMVQTQTVGTSTCTLVSDDVVYDVRLGLSITLGKVEKSYPTPKRTGSIEIADIDGGTRFLSPANELYYEIALFDADDDVVIEDWTEVKLDPQNKFTKLYEYLPPGVYRIKVRDAAGCEKSIDAEIGLDQRVYVPNIFTPNDDGVNDEFEIINLPLTSQHKLIISNRWGEEVFKSGDYREGTFWNANDAADGIYFYRLQVSGGETFTGWVEVLRGSKP